MAGNSSATGSSNVETTDNSWQLGNAFNLPEHSTGQFILRVVARDEGNANSKTWYNAYTFKRVSASPTILGSLLNIVNPVGDIGALGWDIDITGDSSGNVLINVKGANGRTIWWAVEIDALWVYD